MEKQILNVVSKVEEKLGIVVGIDELCEALMLTVRKMQVKQKEPDYFPLLLETELEEVYERKAINWRGEFNRCATFA